MLHKSQGGYPYRMKDFFSIGETAKAAGTTAETLRHYDRIGLVKPGKKDEWTSWRYSTKQDIVCVRTVRALQRMGLPLQKIKEVLAYDDLEKILHFYLMRKKKLEKKLRQLNRAGRLYWRQSRIMKANCMVIPELPDTKSWICLPASLFCQIV